MSAVPSTGRPATGRPIRVLLLVAAGALLAVAAIAVLGRATASPAPAALPPPLFVDETATAGIDHRYSGESDYFVGGGVAVFDCDGDRKPDMYIAGGSGPAGLYRNESEVGGSLRFARIASATTDLASVTGAYPLDVDGDGTTDLAVLRRGGNVLLRGTGSCAFEAANEAWDFDGGVAWSTAFSASWEDGTTGWPTLAIGNYVDQSSEDRERLCFDNELVRPNAEQTGYAAPVPLSPGWCSLSMLFSDWDRSGRRDLRVSNDRHYYDTSGDGEEQLWRMDAAAPPHLYTEAEGWQPVRVWGMGIASYDLTGDGYPEYFLTSQADNKLQTLADGPAEPNFKDMALAAGVTATRPYVGDTTLPSTAWHAEFQDVNNDSFVDLFIGKGNVEAMPDYAAQDPSNLMIGQPDGTFVEGAQPAGIFNYDRARGASLADFNLDGLVDLVVVYRREPVRVWRNTGLTDAEGTDGEAVHWLAIELQGGGSNTSAIGSWIEVRIGERIIQREVTVGGGHAGGQLGWIHFGTGPTSRVEIRVQWPNGEVGPWLPATTDQFVIVERDAEAVEPWQPAPGTSRP
jgi:hypothetical protein